MLYLSSAPLIMIQTYQTIIHQPIESFIEGKGTGKICLAPPGHTIAYLSPPPLYKFYFF